MTKPRGVELARRLVAMSDLVMDNFSARVMRIWGMDYASLAKIKPDIISVSMSGLGHTGPRSQLCQLWADAAGAGGIHAPDGRWRGEPAGFGYSYADMAGGYSGALAALIALWHRRRTGHGQFVDLAQFEALTSLIGPALLEFGQWPHAGAGRMAIARGARRAARRVPMPPAWRRRRSLDRDCRAIAGGVGALRECYRRSSVGDGSKIPHTVSADAQCEELDATSHDGPLLLTLRPRWRCCSAPASPPASALNGADLAADPQLRNGILRHGRHCRTTTPPK